MCGFAAVDIEANTALHYFAAQTLKEEGQGPMDFYCGLLKRQAPELLKMSKYLGVDVYFSKKSFVDTAIENDLHVITRLRDDAALHYMPPPRKEGQMGRPKKYGDSFSVRNIDTKQLPCIAESSEQRIYGVIVYVHSL